MFLTKDTLEDTYKKKLNKFHNTKQNHFYLIPTHKNYSTLYACTRKKGAKKFKYCSISTILIVSFVVHFIFRYCQSIISIVSQTEGCINNFIILYGCVKYMIVTYIM